VFQPIQRVFFNIQDEGLKQPLAGKEFRTLSELSSFLKEQGVEKEEIDRILRYGHNLPTEEVSPAMQTTPTRLGYRESKTTMLRGNWVKPASERERELFGEWVKQRHGVAIEKTPEYKQVIEEQSKLPASKQDHKLAIREQFGSIVEPKEAVEYKGKTYRWITNPMTGERQWWADVDLGVKFGKAREGKPLTGTAATVNLAASMLEAVSEAGKNLTFLSKMNYLNRVGEMIGAVSDDPKAGFVLMEDYAKNRVRRSAKSFAKPFGVLSEKYVQEDIARSAIYYAEMDNYVPKLKSLAKINRWYKKAYLALNHKTWVNVYLGNVTVRLGRKKEAEKHFKAAIGIDPTLDEPYFNLAALCAADGRKKEGKDYYKMATDNGGLPDPRLEELLGL
jgi:tetratricopeptide (TPR) repeat protein